MTLAPVQYLLGGLSGGFVGFSLGIFGGGGSILAVPLVVYLVGVPDQHLAIGTSAFAVAANAATGLIQHARHGVVKWRCAMMFSVAGVLGATMGSTAGKAVDGDRLLFLFALLMIVVGVLMFRSRSSQGEPGADFDRKTAPKVLGSGVLIGALAGFFGIGGGFLIVPGLIASTGMPILNAVASSLVAVCAFGLTTAFNYALSGWVDWRLAIVLILGGVAGGRLGAMTARRAAVYKGRLKLIFAILVFAVAAYVMVAGWRKLA